MSNHEERRQAQIWSFERGASEGRLVWEREFNIGQVYDHCASCAGFVGPQRPAVISPVYGGLVVMDAADGADLLRLYWEPEPGNRGCRNYGTVATRDLDGDGACEVILLNDRIPLQLAVISAARGGSGTAANKDTPWPAPDVDVGELATYEEGPILWRRFYGDWYPHGEYTLHAPYGAIGDIDGDERVELIVSLHKTRWDFHAYDALTGSEVVSVPDLYVHAALDIDDDGLWEIIGAVETSRTPREFTTLVVGNLRDGQWIERWRGAGCRLEYSTHAIRPLELGGSGLDPRVPMLLPRPGGWGLVTTFPG